MTETGAADNGRLGRKGVSHVSGLIEAKSYCIFCSPVVKTISAAAAEI